MTSTTEKAGMTSSSLGNTLLPPFFSSYMKSCRRTRKVWPAETTLTLPSRRSPLPWPSLTNEYIRTDLPTRSIVTSLRAHSPFSNSSLVLSSLTALAFLPVGFFLRQEG